MIMSNPGAIAPVVYGGKVRAVMLYLDRIRMESRGLAPVDVMKATDQFNIFLPTGSVKVGETDYAIDSNSMVELVERLGAMPLKAESGNVQLHSRRSDAQGLLFHPDECCPSRWSSASLYSGLSADWFQHTDCRRHASMSSINRCRND